jgi:hypothetical protein
VEHPQGRSPENEPPPFLGSWRNVYIAVIGSQVVVAFLLWLLSEVAS